MSQTDQHTKPMPRNEWNRLEEIVERFEAAWQQSQRPAIDDYLKVGDVDAQKLLFELIHADLECRLKAGDEVRVETYVERYPQIADDREGVLELIAAEYNFRQRRESHLKIEEYERRFPHYQAEFAAHLRPLRQRDRLPAHLSCPHCHKAMPLSEDVEEKQLICSSCGGSFRFDLAHTPAWSPQALPRLGQFELLKEIGQGAFGTVYRARDADLGRLVAVKVPRIGRWISPADQDRFVREARNVAQLAHPGIVPVYEVGLDATIPYLVSAYVAGVTLANVLASRRFGFRESAEVIVQVAEALHHAHQHGVVHRDLKPSNIMLGRIEGAAAAIDPVLAEERIAAVSAALAVNGAASKAFVMDFGLSRREEGEITVTIEGQILGTPAYMSPEQARGEGHHMDCRGDVYSLGVILYEMLTGEIPFRGVTRMVLQQIQHEEPRAPRRLNDKIPRDLETITLKCMAKEPAGRYATAGEVAVDLNRYLNGEPIQARPVSRWERSWRWCKRNPRMAGLLSLVLVLVATVAIGSPLAAIQIRSERDAANEQLKLASDTLDQLVVKVQEQLQNRPKMQKLMEDLLRTAIPGLEQVARSGRDVDATQHARNVIGAAHERLGIIYLQLGQTALARKHFTEQVAQLDALVTLNPQSTRFQRNLQVSYRRLSEVSLRVGDIGAAQEYARRALELAQRAAAEAGPRDPQALLDLAESYVHRGDANQEVIDVQAIIRDYRTALGFARTAAEVDTKSAVAKRLLSTCHDKLDVMLTFLQDFGAAHVEADKALELREALVAVDPENRIALLDLAEAQERIAIVHYGLVHLPEALDFARKSVKVWEDLVAADPEDTRTRQALAMGYRTLAEIQSTVMDLPAVRENYLKSLKLSQELAAADHDNIFYQFDLVTSYGALGDYELEARNYEEAAKRYQQSIGLLQELQSEGRLKDRLPWQQLLTQQQHRLTICRTSKQAIDDLDFVLAQPAAVAADLLTVRAKALAGRGQYLLAATAAEKLRAVDPKEARYLYNAACCYALCVPSVAQGKSAEQLIPEELARQRLYTARALESLTAAVERGYKKLTKIETDPELAAIRQEEGYRTLIANLKASLMKNQSP